MWFFENRGLLKMTWPAENTEPVGGSFQGALQPL
jgi:hypothetical protein